MNELPLSLLRNVSVPHNCEVEIREAFQKPATQFSSVMGRINVVDNPFPQTPFGSAQVQRKALPVHEDIDAWLVRNSAGEDSLDFFPCVDVR